MDVVYVMDEATLFDSFFNYLQEIEVFPLLENLDPQKQRRKNIPFIQLVLVLLMKVVGSIKTIDGISDLLLTDELKEVPITLYGWKVWVIYEIKTGIPLAIKIDTIERPDNLHVLAVLEQAKQNVKVSSTIDSLVVDRRFLDGKVLYKIGQQGVEFVIPLKRIGVSISLA